MRLVDCYIELFYYTIFLQSLDFGVLSFEEVRKHYEELISRSTEAADKGDFSREQQKKGQFAIFAWIDEVILCSGWAEKGKWVQSPLQLVYFNTTNAGENFFKNLQNFSEDDTSVREVYDYCLALGIKGLYYRPEDATELKNITDSNLRLIAEDSVLAFPEILFPEAYDSLAVRKRSRARFWGMTIPSIIGAILPIVFFLILYSLLKSDLADTLFKYLQLI